MLPIRHLALRLHFSAELAFKAVKFCIGGGKARDLVVSPNSFCVGKVFLSFAPRVLVAGGLGSLEAASIVSLASWVMIFSGAACGQLADRTGRSDLILSVCLSVAMAVLALWTHVGWAVPLSLVFGLVGMAPAGLVMALTGAAMAPHKRAFGMGVFFSAYFVVTAPAPGIAGWLYDKSSDAFVPILFAIALFALTLGAAFAFRLAQRRAVEAT